MNPLLKKLNFKGQYNTLVVINAPETVAELIAGFQTEVQVVESPVDETEFVLIFCTQLAEVEQWAVKIDSRMIDDGLFWFAYPKGTSKRFKCEFNRDNGWQIMGTLGYEPVRMVAIDEDWSALRFRKVHNIKTLNRNPEMVLSKEGMKKAKQK